MLMEIKAKLKLATLTLIFWVRKAMLMLMQLAYRQLLSTVKIHTNQHFSVSLDCKTEITVSCLDPVLCLPLPHASRGPLLQGFPSVNTIHTRLSCQRPPDVNCGGKRSAESSIRTIFFIFCIFFHQSTQPSESVAQAFHYRLYNCV